MLLVNLLVLLVLLLLLITLRWRPARHSPRRWWRLQAQAAGQAKVWSRGAALSCRKAAGAAEARVDWQACLVQQLLKTLMCLLLDGLPAAGLWHRGRCRGPSALLLAPLP
jgi:hypothetical protein